MKQISGLGIKQISNLRLTVFRCLFICRLRHRGHAAAGRPVYSDHAACLGRLDRADDAAVFEAHYIFRQSANFRYS